MLAEDRQITDKMETLILMALDAKHEQLITTGGLIKSSKKNDNMSRIEYDVGAFLNFDDMYPDSSYTVDATGDRLFASTHELLIAHPADIIEDEKEVIMIDCSGTLKWSGYRKTRKPNNVFSIGKPVVWYELHHRQIRQNGCGFYAKRVIPIDSSGNIIPAFFQKSLVCNPAIDGFSIITGCSIIEDAHRANTMLASVKDAKEIKFPIPVGDYMSVFSNREGPMNGSRRKSIIHWVAKHIRHSTKNKKHEVKRHTRGVQEFNIDGLKIRIEPSRYDMDAVI